MTGGMREAVNAGWHGGRETDQQERDGLLWHGGLTRRRLVVRDGQQPAISRQWLANSNRRTMARAMKKWWAEVMIK